MLENNTVLNLNTLPPFVPISDIVAADEKTATIF